MTTELTDWERQILRLCNEGLTNKEIAVHTGSSETAIRSRLRDAQCKLGAFNKKEAVLFAREKQVI